MLQFLRQSEWQEASSYEIPTTAIDAAGDPSWDGTRAGLPGPESMCLSIQGQEEEDRKRCGLSP